MIRRLASTLAVAVAACGAPAATSQAEGGAPAVAQADEPPLFKYSEIQAAIADARANLEVFWVAMGSEAGASCRAQVTTESSAYRKDYVWVGEIEPGAGPDGAHIGRVVEDEADGARFTAGQEIAFTEADITDWMYSEDGKLRGGYTSRAMLDLAPSADTSAIRALYHDSPTP